jgi:hypothetical protein
MRFINNWPMNVFGIFYFRLVLGPIKFISLDIDIYRKFYSFTFLNFTVRNR